ncbi:MAG: hypothetical protein K2I96_14510 [Lachnospiraceae bacterium]|nr:hypothetical protein [Lachnospiraceae bacterium]
MLYFPERKEDEKQDDLIDFESMYTVVKRLGIRNYRPSHSDTCRRIWKELVSKSGQADSLQGELLRQAEKLRHEAINHGNLNWDNHFEWFCNFISRTLKNSNLFEEKQMKTIEGALNYIKECGMYAYQYNTGKISEDDVNPMLFAYTDDDIYDYIEDAIALFAEANPKKITYDVKDIG